MEATTVRASARRWVRLVAGAALLLAAVAGLGTLDPDPAAAQGSDVTWDDSWAEQNYDVFLQETGADPAAIPAEPNDESTTEDWRDSVVAMGDQPGWDQDAAVRAIEALDPNYPVSREEAARIMCVGVGCSSDDTEAQIAELARRGITTGRDGSCATSPNSQACIDGFDAGSTSTNAQTITFLSRVLAESGSNFPPSTTNLPGGPPRNLRVTCSLLQNGRYSIGAQWLPPAGGAHAFRMRSSVYPGWTSPNTGSHAHYFDMETLRPVTVSVETMVRRNDSNPTGYILVGTGSASGGPVCQIPPYVSVVGPVSAQEGAPLVFTLELDRTVSSDVTVYVTTEEDTRAGARPATPGDDYTQHLSTPILADRTLVVIPAGQLQATVDVDTVDDSADEYYETLQLRINYISTTHTPHPLIGDPHSAIGTIIDNDTALAEISIDDGSGDEAGMVRFNVRLAEPSGKVVAASVVTSESSPRSASEAQACGVDDASTDYLARSGRVIFDPGETVKEFTVQTCDDSAEEGHETLDVMLSNPANAVLGVMSAVGVIRDDDIPVVSISGPSRSVDEDTGGVANTATFTVSLDRVGLQPITVVAATNTGTATGAACASGGDFVPRLRTVTFAPGERTKSFDVTTCADAVPENDEDFSVVLSGQSSNAVLGHRHRHCHDPRQRRADHEHLRSPRGRQRRHGRDCEHSDVHRQPRYGTCEVGGR